MIWPHKQHACLCCLDANDKPKSQTWKVCETTSILHVATLCGWGGWRSHSEAHHYSLRDVFELVCPCLRLLCIPLLRLHLLCFARYRYKFWFKKFKQAFPQEDSLFRCKKRVRAPHWGFYMLFWTLKKTRVEAGGGGVREWGMLA